MPRRPPAVPPGPAHRDANAQATRLALIQSARQVFAAHGFGGAGLGEIVEGAQVTTGALYHHFGNKQGLFLAVAESIEQEILDRVVAQLDPAAPAVTQLEGGLSATLELCSEPDVCRILFDDAPHVVGFRAWREVELRYGFGLMRERMLALEAEGRIAKGSADLNAQILLGALMEAAHVAAFAEDRPAAVAQAKRTLSGFLRSLVSDR